MSDLWAFAEHVPLGVVESQLAAITADCAKPCGWRLDSPPFATDKRSYIYLDRPI